MGPRRIYARHSSYTRYNGTWTKLEPHGRDGFWPNGPASELIDQLLFRYTAMTRRQLVKGTEISISESFYRAVTRLLSMEITEERKDVILGCRNARRLNATLDTIPLLGV